MSSRRPQASVTNKAKSALERLRQQRREGQSGIRNYAVNDDDDARLYDEVDEKDYELIRRKRLQEDDFVVDDDGLGYVDYGQEDFDDDAGISSDDMSDDNRKEKKKGILPMECAFHLQKGSRRRRRLKAAITVKISPF